MRKVLLTAAVLLVAAALVSACGGSGSAASGTSGAGAGQAVPTATGGVTGVGEATPATAATSGTGTGEATPTTAATSGTGSGGATAESTAASSGAGGSTAAGDPQAGETLFTSATIGTNPGCKTCHTIDGTKLVGPSLQGIGTRAATSVPGESAQQYIRTSIIDPNAHVVEGYSAGIMPSFKTVLSDTQLNDVVAYLLTLK